MGIIKYNAYRLTLLAFLATLAIVGRNAMAFLPNFQPVTAIIIITGLLLGTSDAILVTIIIVLVSNMYLGMGIWTIYQIISWGMIAAISGYLKKIVKVIPLWTMHIIAVFYGYFYGFIISMFTYQISGEFWPYYIVGLPFDTYHAIGNVVFITILYPIFLKVLQPYIENHLNEPRP